MGRWPVQEVLCYRKNGAPRATVRRHYLEWREARDLPMRCDDEKCFFYSQPLEWNGRPLKPILDHKNGNNSDNRPKNLRLLCPNCDSQQQETRGGANKGRVKKSEGGFALMSKQDGKRRYTVPAASVTYNAEVQPASLVHRKRQGKNS